MASSPQEQLQSMRPQWSLVPGVTDLGAFYDPRPQTLTVSVEGKTTSVIYGFEFVPNEPFYGGLSYNLMAWVGPVLPKPHSYTWSQRFFIPNLGQRAPSNKIIVHTADHPKGEQVEVRWGGLNPGPPPDVTTQESGPLPPGEPLWIPPPVLLNEVFNKPFEITADTKSTGVTIRFDDNFLHLQNAGVKEDGTLFWKFLPIATGPTSALVTYSSKSRTIGNEVYYDIDIILPVSPDILLPSGGSEGEGIVLVDFLTSLRTAVTAVQSQYPGAALYDVKCTPPKGPVYPHTDARELSQLVARFRHGNDAVKMSTVGGWNIWGKPIPYKGPIIGPGTISWPPSPETWTLGLEDAVAALHEDKDAPGSFWSCDLFSPLEPQPGGTQPFYSFLMIDTSTWNVGARDGKVSKA